MTQQERAARTRRALLDAAAEAIDRHGYAAASLTAVSTAAGVTKGALTYHFTSKADLADAVRTESRRRTGRVLAPVLRSGGEPLQTAIDATQAVAGLLGHDPVIRAGARLARDATRTGLGTGGIVHWHASWIVPVHDLLSAARFGGRLHPRADPGEVCGQLGSALLGLDALTPGPGRGAAGDCGPLRHHLTSLWQLLLPGLVPGPWAAEFIPEGSSGACPAGCATEPQVTFPTPALSDVWA
ncbi:ScbR family autoregulator-binding transcription factor [Streptomyces sp. NPDC090022]|uniref:ScbR family autoregulator-binding transcription factor n=1 Tax=Streptomyces sp. NPDC090022 TaxID=3365920 RepID=UPI0037F81993